MATNRSRTRTAEPCYKNGNDIQPSYFYSDVFVESFLNDINTLVEVYRKELNSDKAEFDSFIESYNSLGWRNIHFIYLHAHIRAGFYEAIFRLLFELFKQLRNDNDAIFAITFFIYVVYTTQPRDKHLYRLMHIPIEIDTLEAVKSTVKHNQLLKWTVLQLKFTVHPQQTLLPRQLPATTVIKHRPSAQRSEEVVEQLIRARERLKMLQKRLNLIKDGRLSEIMLGEHLLDDEDEHVDTGLSQFNLNSEQGIEDLKVATAATVEELKQVESEAHRMAIEVMKTYE